MNDSTKTAVYSFGENDKEQWYKGEDGKKVPCGEGTINALWFKWTTHPTRHRADDGNYIIFAMEQPIYL